MRKKCGVRGFLCLIVMLCLWASNSGAALMEQVQPSFREDFRGDKTGLDYAFAEWFWSDLFRVRAGKVKASFMSYTEIYDVGTVRPFFFLPQGVYQEFAAESYKGIGLTGRITLGRGWECSYDLYGGKLAPFPLKFRARRAAGSTCWNPKLAR